MESTDIRRITVGPGPPERLDRFLARQLGISRSRIAGLMAGGLVRVNGRAAKKSESTAPSQVVEVEIPPHLWRRCPKTFPWRSCSKMKPCWW